MSLKFSYVENEYFFIFLSKILDCNTKKLSKLCNLILSFILLLSDYLTFSVFWNRFVFPCTHVNVFTWGQKHCRLMKNKDIQVSIYGPKFRLDQHSEYKTNLFTSFPKYDYMEGYFVQSNWYLMSRFIFVKYSLKIFELLLVNISWMICWMFLFGCPLSMNSNPSQTRM